MIVSYHRYGIRVKAQGQKYEYLQSVYGLLRERSKREGKYQDSIQSSTTPDSGYQ